MFGIIRPENVGYTVFWYLDKWTITIMVIGIFFSSSLPTKFCTFVSERLSEKIYIVGKYVLLIGVLYLAMLRIVSGTYNPFIYFQF